MPPAVRQVLRDAHARLGGTGCGAKEALFPCSDGRGGAHLTMRLNQEGVVGEPGEPGVPLRRAASAFDALLHHARAAGAVVHAVCRDVEAVERAGLQAASQDGFLIEMFAWWLAGLAWLQELWREEVEVEVEARVGGWERRGRCGRRGRRRREPGVVFELGPWGEEWRVLSHEEAGWVLVYTAGL